MEILEIILLDFLDKFLWHVNMFHDKERNQKPLQDQTRR